MSQFPGGVRPREIFTNHQWVGVPLIRNCEGIGIGGPLAPNSPRPLGGLGTDPKEGAGTLGAGRGGLLGEP